MQRTKPNFLVTGTPGVGKTTFSSMLASRFGLLHVPISQLIRDNHLWTEQDEERDCTIYDENLLEAELNNIIASHPEGGIVFDFHCSDVVDIENLDFVLVLRCESDLLWKRLAARGYSEDKIRENVEAEIFRTILDEVIEDFPANMIHEIQSNSIEDLDNALNQIQQALTNNA
ncbi:TAF9 RNA polymerase II, TATA box binding protein (TBP)-associated factor isoform 2 family protein [Histomonas meleagridis]|uniref:TAF9 RNA polymerase II, TATA box binding protein (TBP)-associated factor isoform 2 family protein n=1 Tax=Histomonas meleagridis TaxID=135588 RepID=UPI00355A5410|nr:TAF9 RNA polymerase II, TATA box binding protein (TBP)-associated factor isoform 2 family protein [Histomonas meleagridis]KAH0801100.1 TAF9 RNA polymerase II, TATA box binding protein (TBP)-associated factor isoform 2 family protein [Histomonas meleagridis]